MRADDDRYPDEDIDERFSAYDPAQPGRRRYADHGEQQRRDPEEQWAEVTDRLDSLTQQLDQNRGRGPDDSLAAVKARLDALAASGKMKRGLVMDDARRIMWMYTGRETYRMLVEVGGWSAGKYQDWLASALIDALIDKPERR